MREMKLAVIAALVASACVPPTAPDPPPPSNNTFSCIGQNACNTGAPASPDPGSSGAAGGCAIGSVGNSLHGTSEQGGIKSANLRVGEQRMLDTTPKQPNGQVLGANCPIAAVSWSNTSPMSCRLNSSSVYTPMLTALAAGTCELRATVGSVTASEPIVISVLAAGALWWPPTLAELLGAPPTSLRSEDGLQ
jgi:hypothetical protein